MVLDAVDVQIVANGYAEVRLLLHCFTALSVTGNRRPASASACPCLIEMVHLHIIFCSCVWQSKPKMTGHRIDLN